MGVGGGGENMQQFTPRPPLTLPSPMSPSLTFHPYFSYLLNYRVFCIRPNAASVRRLATISFDLLKRKLNLKITPVKVETRLQS